MRRLFALFSCDMSSSSWDFHVLVVVEGLGIGVPDFEREKICYGIIDFFKKIGRVATNGSVFKANESEFGDMCKSVVAELKDTCFPLCAGVKKVKDVVPEASGM
nr:hypothetical protein [Tanacetum cinerariifolium]